MKKPKTNGKSASPTSRTEERSTRRRIPLDGGGLLYFENYWPAPEADRIFATLERELEWTQQRIKLFGNEVPEPRLSAWYGDPIATYTYSGATRYPLPWPDELIEIRDRAISAAGTELNSCLANFYRHGQDSMGWHSDDEKELGPNPVVVSASFGEPRRFRLKNKATGETTELTLSHGSLLVMEAGTQEAWKHAIPKTARSIGGRINLTFRRIFGIT